MNTTDSLIRTIKAYVIAMGAETIEDNNNDLVFRLNKSVFTLRLKRKKIHKHNVDGRTVYMTKAPAA